MWEAIAFIFWNILVPAGIAYGISLLLAKEPESEAGNQRIQLPTATEGRPFPVLFGCRMIRGINAISPFFYRYTYFRVYHEEKAANLYYVAFHVGIAQCLDGVKQLWWGGVHAWPHDRTFKSDNDIDNYAADGTTSDEVKCWDLWGDWIYGGQGGVAGDMDILYGEDDQALNSYLQTKLGSSQPYYRGFVSIVFKEPFYIGVAPTIRPIAVLGKRTDQFCDHSTMWHSTKAAIGSLNDMNPVHIVYELLTSTLVGRGISTSLIGDSFEDSADTLYDENFGLSCVWDYAPDDIDSMIGQIEKIVDGKLYFDYDTESFEFGLNRADYTADELEIFDEDDFWVESSGYLSPGRLPSKVIVYWEHRQYEGKRIAYDDDIALLAKQGGITNVQEYDFHGFVCDGDIANTIAARQQYVFSSMPKRFTLRCLRTMAHLHETDVFKISYPELNIGSMIVRLVSIDRGSLANGEVIIECIEDVFGYAYTIYGTPPDPAVDSAALEMNIAVDNIVVTDSITMIMDWGINIDDDITVTDFSDITIA